MFKITKSSRKNADKISEIIYDEVNASIKSRAAYVLLRNKLHLQDEDYINRLGGLWKWLDVREVFLTRRQKENSGNLVCDYCGKEHLEIGGKKPEDLSKNNKNSQLATVDHIHPLVNDGEKYNEENMCVSCKKCNRTKGEKSLEDYLNSLPKEKLEKTAKFLIDMITNKNTIKKAEKIVLPKKIKKLVLPKHIRSLNAKRLLAYYKSQRKKHHRFVSSRTCDCCGEASWHLYDDENSNKAREDVIKSGKNLDLIKEELNKREHVV